MIQPERIRLLNQRRTQAGRYVLYWMQASQRAACNHALEYAILQANELRLPLVVFFGLTTRFPGANARHYAFMLEGLREVRRALEARGIRMIVRVTSPELGAVDLAGEAALVVVDRGYLRLQRQWYAHVAERIPCPLIQVESNVVVPVETASPKEEYSAATIRRKIAERLDAYLLPLTETQPVISAPHWDLEALDLEAGQPILAQLDVDAAVHPVTGFHGGTSEARRHLHEFIAYKLDRYAALRNDPTQDVLSQMSPYLHFGQISPLEIALQVRQAGCPSAAVYLEELIVRRELSMNYVYYNPLYDTFAGLPAWAQQTLCKHAEDPREYLYTPEQLERGETHDPYWNAAQKEMALTGKMHGYMRMYWGKKLIEWTRTPQEAHQLALYLNDKYELDGRDPNGFTGVAWCFGKHDRPWGERPILGLVRSMSANGLRRKFDADGYVRRVEQLARSLKGEKA